MPSPAPAPAPAAPEVDVGLELEHVAAIADEADRLRALDDLAPQVREPGHAARALSIASGFTKETLRARALRPVLRRLPPALYADALSIAQGIGDDEARRRALAELGERMSKEDQSSVRKRWAEWLAGLGARDLLLVGGSLIVAIALFLGLAWLCWRVLLPPLWGSTYGAGQFNWWWLVAWFPMLYLAIGPFVALPAVPWLLEFWREYGAVNRQVKTARRAQERVEQELLRDDPQKLVRLLSYSRHMLSEYYAIATNQAQRSFRYCLIAMWLGFFVLLVGVFDKLFHLSHLLGTVIVVPAGAPAAPGPLALTPNELVLLTGVVLEFIAAAFLWVYRFSIQQQTYYYRRQLKLHNVLLAYRLTERFQQSRDDAVKLIIQRLLDDLDPQKIDAPSTSGLGRWFKPKEGGS